MPKLTKRILDATKPDPSKEVFVWCSALPGFGARIYPSGKTVFIAQVRVGRAQRRVKIGPHGAFTVDQARESAEAAIRAAAEGRDPQLEKQELRDALSVAELCDVYMEAARAGRVLTRFGQAKRPSTLRNDAGRIERHIKPLLGKRKARDITAADIQRMVDSITEGKTAGVTKTELRGKAVVTGGPSTAARVSELVGGIWTWGAKRKHVPALSVTKGVDKAKTQPKDRTLSAEELQALGKAIREATSPTATTALRLIALTGTRREEIVALKWCEIDLEGSCLQLGATKTGRSTRPIGSAVVALLRKLAKSKTDDKHVFPNSRRTGSADLKKGIAAIFDAAKLTDARSHDLRRTFASIGDELGYSEATIGEVLGHSSRTVTGRHYIRRPDAALVAAATKISDRIASALEGKPAAEILLLHPRSNEGAA